MSAQGHKEIPACVQNAMVTKDKKPFTYTPGGIDLSQIKSERMAKRLARNAIGDFNTKPCAEVPAPPPPPMMTLHKNTPPNAGANKEKVSTIMEPPPLGFRPKIEIPPNPISNLKKVAPPKEKNTFWKDEYIKERTGSYPEPQQTRDDYVSNTDDDQNNQYVNETQAPIQFSPSQFQKQPAPSTAPAPASVPVRAPAPAPMRAPAPVPSPMRAAAPQSPGTPPSPAGSASANSPAPSLERCDGFAPQQTVPAQPYGYQSQNVPNTSQLPWRSRGRTMNNETEPMFQTNKQVELDRKEAFTPNRHQNRIVPQQNTNYVDDGGVNELNRSKPGTPYNANSYGAYNPQGHISKQNVRPATYATAPAPAPVPAPAPTVTSIPAAKPLYPQQPMNTYSDGSTQTFSKPKYAEYGNMNVQKPPEPANSKPEYLHAWNRTNAPHQVHQPQQPHQPHQTHQAHQTTQVNQANQANQSHRSHQPNQSHPTQQQENSQNRRAEWDRQPPTMISTHTFQLQPVFTMGQPIDHMQAFAPVGMDRTDNSMMPIWPQYQQPATHFTQREFPNTVSNQQQFAKERHQMEAAPAQPKTRIIPIFLESDVSNNSRRFDQQ